MLKCYRQHSTFVGETMVAIKVIELIGSFPDGWTEAVKTL